MLSGASHESGLDRLASGARHLGLDAIRGLAIGLVICHHVGLRFPNSVRDPLARFLVDIGWGGVDIFFAISGFLITRILMRGHSRGQIASFFRKRFWRIVPLYALALLLYAVSSRVTGHEAELRRIWIPTTFLTGWAIPFLGPDAVPYTISWSLSVEEFAYILLGLTALAGRRALTRLVILLVFVPPLLRAAMIYGGHYPPLTIYYFVPGRLDAIALGATVAMYPRAWWRLSQLPPWLPVSATLFALSVLSTSGRIRPEVAVFGYSLTSVCAAWLVSSVAARTADVVRGPTRVAAALGLVSYFVYLFHLFLVAAIGVALRAASLPTPNWWFLLIATTGGIYAPAVLSWRWLEIPLMERGLRARAADSSSTSAVL